MINNSTLIDIKEYILKYNTYFNNAFALLYPIVTEQGYALFNTDGEMAISSIYDDSLGNYFYIRTNGQPIITSISMADCDKSYRTIHKYTLVAFVDGIKEDVLFNLFHTLNNYRNVTLTNYQDNKSQVIYEECGQYTNEIMQRIKNCISVLKIDFEITYNIGEIKNIANCIKQIKCICCG